MRRFQKKSAPTRSFVMVNTGNGHGSATTYQRRWTTLYASSGYDITYTEHSANGATFTVNTPGRYTVCYGDRNTAGSSRYGVSVNTTAVSATVSTLTWAQGYRGSTIQSSSGPETHALTLDLSAGDVVRTHTNNSPNSTDANDSFFIMEKVSEV